MKTNKTAELKETSAGLPSKCRRETSDREGEGEETGDGRRETGDGRRICQRFSLLLQAALATAGGFAAGSANGRQFAIGHTFPYSCNVRIPSTT